MQEFIESRRDQIAELCRRHHVSRLAIFGSALRDDFDPAHSDVDLLVEFEPLPSTVYAPNFFSLTDELQYLFNRRVDLLVPTAIRNPYLKQTVERDREKLYVAA